MTTESVSKTAEARCEQSYIVTTSFPCFLNVSTTVCSARAQAGDGNTTPELLSMLTPASLTETHTVVPNYTPSDSLLGQIHTLPRHHKTLRMQHKHSL